MKKFSWMVALLIALSLALIGCPTGGGGGGGEGPGTDPGDTGWTHNLGSGITIKLTDNFKYGDGYQGTFDDSKLFEGQQVAVGDEYNLKITFTASRDLKDILYVGLVDTTAAASYWAPLTWTGDPAKPAPVDGSEDDKIILQDEEVSVTVKMTAIKAASDASAAANTLVFMTDSPDGTKGNENSGTLGTITLTFTEFIFAKGDIDDGTQPQVSEEKVIFENGDWVDLPGVTLATGTKSAAGITAVKGDDNGKLTTTIEFSFTAIDISEYTELKVEWSGFLTDEDDVNMWQPQTKIILGSQAVTHQSTFNASPKSVIFATDAKDWDAAWADVDKTGCTGIRLYSNYLQRKSSSYAQVNSADTDITDLVITKISFVK